MPYYAHLSASLRCPFCNTTLADIVWFSWGFCPGYSAREDYLYKIDDSVHWKPCSDGSILSWTTFDDTGANIGDPLFHHLIIRDDAQYYLKQRCPSCKQEIEGAAIEIQDNIITRAWVVSPRELGEHISTYSIVAVDKTLTPMPEWDDHLLSTTATC